MNDIVLHPLKPIYDEDSKVLILGSFPSVISRIQNFYYANKNNRFWYVLSALYDEEIIEREEFCHDHHIALWDVIQSCTIIGSKDDSINNVIPNNISKVVAQTKIKCIFTTGRKASILYEKYNDINLEHISLPSTSSANAKFHIEDLLESYKIIKEYTDEEN